MKKIQNYVYIVVFIILVLGLGVLSGMKLVRFYVKQEIDYNEWTPELGNKFETDIASTFYQKFQFVNLNGAVSHLLGQSSMNNVVKLNNGHLMTPVQKSDDALLRRFADPTIQFHEYLKKRGTSLVYVSPPCTPDKYDPQLPAGVEDYSNDNVDRFIKRLSEAGIDTIDIREEMYKDGIEHYDMMYKTDHHWTTRAGFYTYGILEEYIVEKTGCEVDSRISDIDHYTVTLYEDWHLGSNGQRTGIYYTGIDDFELILPEFRTIIQNGSGSIGSMQDLIINTEPLEDTDYTSRYTYDWVLWGSQGNFTNLDCPNDIRILIISDSFSNALNPYLIMGFKQLQYVYDADVSGVTPGFIESYDPDVVIMMYYPNILQNGYSSFAFYGFQ